MGSPVGLAIDRGVVAQPTACNNQINSLPDTLPAKRA